MSDAVPETLVIGLGNPLLGDDGLGIVALDRLEREWEVPAAVRLVDGGTLGLSLLPVLEQAGAVLLLDAVEAGLDPGAPVMLEGDQLPRRLCHRTSCHQSGLPEVLALGELRGTLPARLVVVGLQPGQLEAGHGLSPPVVRGLDLLLRAVVARLESWGHRVPPRPRPREGHRTDQLARLPSASLTSTIADALS